MSIWPLVGRPLARAAPYAAGIASGAAVASDYDRHPIGGSLKRWKHDRKRYREEDDETPSKRVKLYKRFRKMPNNKMARRRYARRIRRRRAPFRRRRSRVPRSLTLTPRTKLVMGKTVKSQSLACTNGALQALAIQACNIIDPFQANGAEQPLGFDQWKALYNSAKVLGTKVVVQWHNAASASVIVGITRQEQDGYLTPTSFEQAIEFPNTKYKYLSPDVDKCVMIGKGSTKKMLHRASIKDTEDLRNDIVDDTEPTVDYQFLLWAQPHDKATTGDVELIITLYQSILLYDRITPARSSD